jgi:hypothetical protein
MEMWGILISSSSPEHLADVMRKVNKEIDKTQQLLQETYQEIEEYSKWSGQDEDIAIDPDFKNVFDKLEYSAALDQSRLSLSMIDILLIQLARKNPGNSYNFAARKLCEIFYEDGKPKEKYRSYIEALNKNGIKRPFDNYIRVGLHQEPIPNSKTNQNQTCDSLRNKKAQDREFKAQDREFLDRQNLGIRKVVLDFALQYNNLVNNPADFDPDALQQSAENLNSVLNPVVRAINRDVEELFIEPTLAKIQSIVNDCDEVSYAEIGKTSVQGLNGIQSEVTSTTVSAFDETGPLRLNELLREASDLNQFSEKLIPAPAGANTVPGAPVLSLIAALSKDRSLWRGLTSGVSMIITPSVLRNSASAELNIDFTTGPTKDKEKEETYRGDKLRPLSRITQNTVKTSVYVNTLDIFALSTFNSQTTEDGGRSYIPVIGTIWQGVFSGIPIFGELFTWQNPPNNVQHQSIVLTNSFIVPTAMGLAHLYGVGKDGGIKTRVLPI